MYFYLENDEVKSQELYLDTGEILYNLLESHLQEVYGEIGLKESLLSLMKSLDIKIRLTETNDADDIKKMISYLSMYKNDIYINTILKIAREKDLHYITFIILLEYRRGSEYPSKDLYIMDQETTSLFCHSYQQALDQDIIQSERTLRVYGIPITGKKQECPINIFVKNIKDDIECQKFIMYQRKNSDNDFEMDSIKKKTLKKAMKDPIKYSQYIINSCLVENVQFEKNNQTIFDFV